MVDFSELLMSPPGRLVLASLLGAAIGVEREWRRHGEGLRSCSLVAMATCTFAYLGITYGGNSPGAPLGAIIQGVGFLGAGVIMHEGARVGGLATAATFLSVAAVGALAGVGEIGFSLTMAGMTFAAHLLLRPISRLIARIAPPFEPPSEHSR